jgi:hypothetical protein
MTARPPFVMALLALCATGLHAQVPGERLTLDHLRIPAAPALILLGVAPSVVERPTAPSVVAVSLLAATGGDNLLPQDYALELAPYWLAPHPTLTFDRYYAPGLGRGMLQTLSLSVATAPLSRVRDTTASGTAVGLGARTFLLAGRAHPELAARNRALQAIQASASQVVLDLEEVEDEARRAVLERRLDSLDAAAREVALEMQRLDTERVGWIVEAAGAVTLEFPGDRSDSGSVGRWGGWLTLLYRLPAPTLDLVAVGRYERDERADPARDLVALGGRLAWRITDLTASVELLQRFGDRAPTGELPGRRITGNLEYHIPGIGYLTAALGSDDDGTASRLVATFGIEFGFGTIPLLLR